jgi:hypothetical protein
MRYPKIIPVLVAGTKYCSCGMFNSTVKKCFRLKEISCETFLFLIFIFKMCLYPLLRAKTGLLCYCQADLPHLQRFREAH